MRDNKNRTQSERRSGERLDVNDDGFTEESDEMEEDVGTPRSLMLVDQLLYTTHENDHRRSLLYELRRAIIEDEVTFQEARQAIVDMQEAVDKLTAPANRIGTLLGFPKKGIARSNCWVAQSTSRTLTPGWIHTPSKSASVCSSTRLMS